MKNFKDTMAYPIIFMLITCVVFVGVLAIMYRGSEAKIATYKKDSYQKQVLNLLSETIASSVNTTSELLIKGYPDTYYTYIKETNMNRQTMGSAHTQTSLNNHIFVVEVNDTVLGYCIDITGKGLWGTMRALVALSPDMKTILGLSIYEQMETPGLGARIGEEWFVNQFKDFVIIKDDASPGDYVKDILLVPEGQVNNEPNQIRQITGATITSSSVLKMLKDELNLVYAAYQRNKP